MKRNPVNQGTAGYRLGFRVPSPKYFPALRIKALVRGLAVGSYVLRLVLLILLHELFFWGGSLNDI